MTARFSGDNGEKNRALALRLAHLATAKGVKPSQLAALDVTLTASEVEALEAAIPATEVAGTRYAAPLMAMLDSEK